MSTLSELTDKADSVGIAPAKSLFVEGQGERDAHPTN
jgi:hypothetical protein